VTDVAVLATAPAPGAEPGTGSRGRPYLTYALRRLAQAVVVIVAAYVLSFILITVLPGNPIATVLGSPQSGLSPAQVRQLESYYGVSQPITVQLWRSLSRFARGQLGVSLVSHQTVTSLIAGALPYTLKLAGLALLIALVLSGAIAYGTQYLPGRWARGVLRSAPSLFLSVPNFIIGLLLIHYFSFQLHLFDVLDPDSLVGTFFAAIALAIPICAPLAEVLISNLDHERGQEYVLVARSRGLTQAKLFARHLVKPSMLPAVTIAALIVGELMGGALITEEVFGRNGIGSVMYQAVSNQDTPVLQGVVALAAVVFVVVNLIADLVAPLLDPRVRLAGGRGSGERGSAT
jgi:peptide/nickel transport system permease protein